MKKSIFIYLIILSTAASGQTAFLKDAVVKLDQTLLTKDTATLKQLLHNDLTFGHSNGWVQSKRDVIRDLRSGKFLYKEIENKDFKWTVTDDVVTLRNTSEVRYILDGKDGDLKLHVLQVWRKASGRWQLFARQSTRI